MSLWNADYLRAENKPQKTQKQPLTPQTQLHKENLDGGTSPGSELSSPQITTLCYEIGGRQGGIWQSHLKFLSIPMVSE